MLLYPQLYMWSQLLKLIIIAKFHLLTLVVINAGKEVELLSCTENFIDLFLDLAICFHIQKRLHSAILLNFIALK